MSHPTEEVVDLIFGRWRSQTLYAGVELGVFEALAGGERAGMRLSGHHRASGPPMSVVEGRVA